MSKTQKPYWRRRKPAKAFDIPVLRPPSLPRGERFETVGDAAKESERSEALLRRAAAPRHLIEYLAECRAGDYVCEKLYCPSCARRYRRWFVGQALRVADARPTHIVTVLLGRAPTIDNLDPEPFRHLLRKRLDRAGLSDVVVIGGFEIVWRAAEKDWVLHANLLILDAPKSALTRFEDSFAPSVFERPTQTVVVRDPPAQVSYLLKFSTYHRPLRQVGPRRSPAKPLNAKEHVALVNWMWRYSFSDMLFLYGARRRGDRLAFTPLKGRD